MRKTVKFYMCLCVMMICILMEGCASKEQGDTGFSEEFEVEEEQGFEDGKEISGQSDEKGEKSRKESSDESESDSIFVHVCGQVCNPGVYELSAHSRVYEAIQAAGGMTDTAAFSYLNQAEELTDGQQLFVPSEEEAMQIQAGVANSGDSGVAPGTSGGNADDGKVNLNTADLAQLTTLTGIGEARARAILQYREEHGSFQSIEELMNVEGIKEGTFHKISDQIKI